MQTDIGFNREFTDDMAHHTGPLTPLNKTVYYTCSLFINTVMSISDQDSIVGIVTRLWAGWSGVQTPVEARDFSLL
jgi:hypothetical protein